MNFNKNLVKIGKIALSIGIISFLLYSIGINNLIKTFSGINAFFLIPPCLILLLSTFIKVYRWKLVLKKIGKVFSYKDLLKYTFMSMPFQLITPSESGDLIRAVFVKREDFPLHTGIASVVADRVFDVLTFFIFGATGAILFLSNFLQLKNFILVLLFPLACFLGLFVLTNEKISKQVLKPVSKLFFKIIKKKNIVFEEFYNDFKKVFQNKKQFAFLLALTGFAWFLVYLCMYFYFLSFNASVPLLYVILIPSFSSMASLLPITVGGLGVREGLLVVLFELIGISASITLAVSFVGYVISFIFVIPGIILYIKNK